MLYAFYLELSKLFILIYFCISNELKKTIFRLYADLEKSNKMSSKKILKYDRLRNYCFKFNCVKRAETYDYYQNKLREEEK